MSEYIVEAVPPIIKMPLGDVMDRKYLVEGNFVDEKFSQIAFAFVLEIST